MKEFLINLSLLMTKLKASLIGIASIIGAFLLPIAPLIYIVTAFIGMDTIMGILRARKTKEKVTSRRMSKIASKSFLYLGSLVLIFVVETYIAHDFIKAFTSIELFLTKLMAATLVFIEAKSVNENYEIISGVSIWDKFKELLSRGKELKKEFGELTEDKKEDKPEEDPEV